MIQPPNDQSAAALLASLAAERLRRFRQAIPDGRHSDVVRLYVLDCQLAEQYQALFRAVEILLRETIHRTLANTFGSRWFAESSFRSILDPLTVAAIDKAIVEVTVGRRAPSAGMVVAEIMLGTWVKLLAKGPGGRHETGIWIPALSSAFQGGMTPPERRGRADVYAPAQRFLWARNRVNHCEPVVFGFPLPGQMTADGKHRRLTPRQLLDDVRTLATMMDVAVGSWMASWVDADTLLADPLAGNALAFMDRQPRISLEGLR